MEEPVLTSGAETVVGVVGEPTAVTTIDGEGVEQQAPQPLDPAFVARASEYNMTEDDLRALPRDVVERMIAGADRRMIDAHRREQQVQPQYQPSPYGYPANAPAAAPPQGYQPPQQFGPQQQPQQAFAPFDLKFDPEAEVAEPIAKNMAAMNQYYAEQLNRMHQHYGAQLQQYQQSIGQITQQRHYDVLDRFIDGLGPEWNGVFGKGASLDMDQRSQEFRKRDELGMAAVSAMDLYQRQTGRPLPAAEALRRAQYAMFAEKAFAVDRAKAAVKEKQVQAAVTDRPRSTGPAGAVQGIRGRAMLMAGVNPGRQKG